MLEKTIKFLLLFFTIFSFAEAQVERKTINSGIINGAAKILPKPDYPEPAKDLCAYGRVEVETIVYLASGEVVEAKAISGDELLREPAEIAARKAKFSVPMINGDTNFNIKGILVYNFLKPKNCHELKRVVNDKAKFLPKPEVPKNCRDCGGSVSVEVVIDQIGDVLRARAISGHPLLRLAAEKAARRAKFAPTNEVGKIRVKAILVYNFDSKNESNKDIPVISALKAQVIWMPTPKYPEAAKAVKASGNVSVEVLIDEKGNVKSAEAKNGHPLLYAAAVEAALKAKFKPTTLNGKAVKIRLPIVYNFFLND